jgi:integration host factor subunit beta
MTKSEFIDVVAARIPHLTRKDAEVIVDTIFSSMTEALVKGERIEIRGFASFKVKDRAPRQGRNPKTGELVQVPARRMPYFKASPELNKRINKTES